MLTDVLEKNTDGSYTIYEIKNSVDFKDVHLRDLSVQYFVCKNRLVNIREFNLVLKIENDDNSFKIINLTQQLEDNMSFVAKNISIFKNILTQSSEPQIDMGNQCDYPYECDFKEYCKNGKIVEINNGNTKNDTYKNDNNLVVDDIELDKDNKLFFDTVKLVLETERKLIYLTGKAGTGKSTFLKYIRQIYDGNVAVLAPTGVAAVNVKGQTIHSFFKIKPSVYVPNDVRLRKRALENDTDGRTIYHHFSYDNNRLSIIKELELLIIDEISMVRCDLLDVVDRLLRVFRKKENLPFGGVQVLLIGDTFQLPPIAKRDEWDVLEKFYDSPFFFSSQVIQKNKPIYIELKKIYRQKEEEFIELLNRVRINQIGKYELDLLNSKVNPTFIPKPNSNYITLATHNRIVESTNLAKLSELQTELIAFEASILGTFPDETPTDKILQLKEGAQIMFVKNDTGKRYYNGKIAKVNKIEGSNIIVGYENEKGEEIEIFVDRQVWENIIYTWDEEQHKVKEEIIGTFTQYPIKLAWSITIHKSQGLTFEKVIADLSNAFASGQVYVALSRCKTLSGLVLKTRITTNAIIVDEKVIEFAENETPENMITEEYEKGKADKMYKKCREAFENNSSYEMLEYLNKAVKLRDDRDTPKFKQYISVKIGLFHRYKQQLIKHQETIKEKEKLIDSHLKKAEELKKEIVFLCKTNDDKDNLIAKLNTENNQALGKINSLNEKILLTENLANQEIKKVWQTLSKTQQKLLIEQKTIEQSRTTTLHNEEKNTIHLGKITRKEKYGIFVKLYSGKMGLVHVSEMTKHNKSCNDYNLGDQINVRILSIDNKNRISLTLVENTTTKLDKENEIVKKQTLQGNNDVKSTIRDVLKQFGAKGYTNWRNTDTDRKACYFKGSDGNEYMILTGDKHMVREGETPDLKTPVIINKDLQTYFTETD